MKTRIKFIILSLFLVIGIFIGFDFSKTKDVQAISLDFWDIYPPSIDVPTLSPSLDIDVNSLLPNDGRLKAYDTLRFYNTKSNTKYGSFKYLSFIEYFDLKYVDTIPFYDDNGILDNGEKVDKMCEIWIKTKPMPHNMDGFLGTVINSKWEYCTIRLNTGSRFYDFSAHDLNSNTMASGKYRNSGVNPGNEYYKLTTLINGVNMPSCYSESNFTVSVLGYAYWENGWWGGTGDRRWFNEQISDTFKIQDRNSDNSITIPNDVRIGTYSGRPALYSAKPFVITTTNLNNFVNLNVNGGIVPLVPIFDETKCVAYEYGYRVLLSERCILRVERDLNFDEYYVFIDDELPGVRLTYLNENAIERMSEGTITTDKYNMKTQKFTGGIFKDQISFEYNINSNIVWPYSETATYTYNNQTFELTSGTFLNKEGSYKVEITTFVGHKKIFEFQIVSSSPQYNLDRLESDTTYKISKWYLAEIPYGYTGYGKYSFDTYEKALSCAMQYEQHNRVTEHYLSNIDDFHYSNLLAPNNTVKIGYYWYYKSTSNPELYLYYFDETSLHNALQVYAEDFITGPNYYSLRSDINPNDYGNQIDRSIYHNKYNEQDCPAFIANNFTFKYLDDILTYKIFYKFLGAGETNFIEFFYNIPFAQQTRNHGLYLIKEIDFVGHETFYYVFLDLHAPILEVEAKTYGNSNSFIHTISQTDIPKNGELVFYYESMNLNNIIEDDKWWVMQIQLPGGQLKKYSFLDELPNLEDLGVGEFKITLYDRVDNNFSFKVYISGKAPTATFQSINANTQCQLSIKAAESFNTIMDLKIYRNGILLNSEFGYDEQNGNPLIFISAEVLNYTFNRGGYYVVEITDNFGRTLTFDYKFEKDLPIGVLVGVSHNGSTKNDVDFIFNSSKYYATVNTGEYNFEPIKEYDETGKLTTFHFSAEPKTIKTYVVYLYDINDFENFNIYTFTINTALPELFLVGASPDEVTASDVYATWDFKYGLSCTYSHNGFDKGEYTRGKILTLEGIYSLTLSDELGNNITLSFEIKKTLNIVILANDEIVDIEEVRFTNKNILIQNNELLTIIVLKDNVPYEYNFNNYLFEDGTYLIQIHDDYGNNKFFYITIDKVPPSAILHNVENNGITNEQVWLTWEETDLVAVIYRNGTLTGNYLVGANITLSGKYIIIISDKAGNEITFNFDIDNVLNYNINTFLGGISNGGVRILSYEYLTVEMFRNGESFDYEFEQIINDEGYYYFILTDELGNQNDFYFTIINKPKQRLEHEINEHLIIEEITKDNTVFENAFDSSFYFIDEGNYQVSVYDPKTEINYSFVITIDITPPILDLVGVTNGGSSSIDSISTKNVSELNTTILAYKDGEEFKYNIGDIIQNTGEYKLILVDEAGNETVYTFTKTYALNGASIVLIGGLLAMAVVGTILIFKARGHFYKDEEEIEEAYDE